MSWLVRGRSLDCADGPVIMGIVNVTPDSFYDGGRYPDSAAAVDQALRLIDEGAGIVDIGGESSRPPMYGQSAAVPADVECDRVIPVIEALRRQCSVAISVDTTKAAVAVQALDEGADIVNDISALTADPEMLPLVARSGAGVVLMHMRGTPRTMQQNTHYDDLMGEVTSYLAGRLAACVDAGVDADCVALDPGIGFGKSVAGNLELIAGLRRLGELGQPLLVGASRKSFIWKTLGESPAEGLEGSLAVAVISVLHGAQILRVHDVGPTKRAARMAAAVMRAGSGRGPGATP